MFGYILRRLLQVIPVFFGATLLIYFMVFALPGDPIIALFGDRLVSVIEHVEVLVEFVVAFHVIHRR